MSSDESFLRTSEEKTHEKLRYLRNFFEKRCSDGIEQFELETQNFQMRVECLQGKFESVEITNKRRTTKCTPILRDQEETLECKRQ